MEKFFWTDNAVRFFQPREAALARARRRAISTDAVVSGGEWHSSDLFNMDRHPAPAEARVDPREGLVAEADPDAWLRGVDRHRGRHF